MKESKHTPGPWGYWPECCRKGGMVTESKFGAHVAAPTYHRTRPELTEANALLISAAPDLLEALVVAQAYIEDFYKLRANDTAPINSDREQINTAIAKATGE